MKANQMTPQTAPAEFITALNKLGFVPGRWDQTGTKDRYLDLNNKDGHCELRVLVDYQGEAMPHNIELIRFNGGRNQLVDWKSSLCARMPSAGVLALLKASLP